MLNTVRKSVTDDMKKNEERGGRQASEEEDSAGHLEAQQLSVVRNSESIPSQTAEGWAVSVFDKEVLTDNTSKAKITVEFRRPSCLFWSKKDDMSVGQSKRRHNIGTARSRATATHRQAATFVPDRDMLHPVWCKPEKMVHHAANSHFSPWSLIKQPPEPQTT